MRRAAELVAALLVAALFAVIVLGVARRYLFGVPLIWADEAAAILFVWLVFWTGALVLRLREHVAFEIVYEMLPPAGRRALGLAGAAVCALALGASTPKIVDFVMFLWRERTPVLQWRLDWLYSCFVLFIVAAAVRFAAWAVALMRERWREDL
jgi:TRAP-type C4-dicarboxylate transport system permease small subunit